MPTADWDDIFSMGVMHSNRAIWLNPLSETVDFRRLSRGEVELAEPYEFTIYSGKRVDDFLGSGLVVLTLMSPRMVPVLEDHGFIGWSTFPARFPDANEQALLGEYAGLVITGRSGPIDDSLSEQVTLPPEWPRVRSVSRLRGQLFDPETWDGSDLFMPGETMFTFVTSSVKEALEAAKITGIKFEPIREILACI